MLRGVPQGGGASTAAAHGSERRAHRSAAELHTASNIEQGAIASHGSKEDVVTA